MNVLCHSYGYANTALLFLQLSSSVCHPFLFQKQKRYLHLHYYNHSLCTAPCRNSRHNNKFLLDTWRIAHQLRDALGYLPFSNNPTLHDATSYLLSKNPMEDRKSTRLNSSHVAISYAVFCLKKKRYASWCRRRCRRGRSPGVGVWTCRSMCRI